MGGAFGGPATLVDLGTDVSQLYRSTKKQKQVGWYISGVPLSRSIQGLQHVDDALVFSTVFCDECVERGMCRLWPRDVGVEVEERGQSITFLRSQFTVLDGKNVIVQPATPNSD